VKIRGQPKSTWALEMERALEQLGELLTQNLEINDRERLDEPQVRLGNVTLGDLRVATRVLGSQIADPESVIPDRRRALRGAA
jgi:hypothetical protein